MLTCGDGVADIDIHVPVTILHSHGKMGKLRTMIEVQPEKQFSPLELLLTAISGFFLKNHTVTGLGNGGFVVCAPEIFDSIADTGDTSAFEQ